MSVRTIQFKDVWHIKSMVNQLSFLNDLKKGDAVSINFLFNATTIMPQYLAMTVSAINHAKERGVKIDFPQYSSRYAFNKSESKYKYNDYASRMNFFKLLGIKVEERFYRRNPDNNFIEITQVGVSNNSDKEDVELVKKVIKMFEKHCNVEETVLASLNFCVWELIDNAKNHSCSETCTITAQFYSKKDEIILCIIDNGIGIHRALTETEGSDYASLTPKEALEKCTENNVTDGKGAGFGLYSYKSFVEQNRGDLIIYSGNYYQEFSEGKSKVLHSTNWPGTIIYNRIKNKNKIDYHKVFGTKIPTSVSEYNESINGLW